MDIVILALTVIQLVLTIAALGTSIAAIRMMRGGRDARP